MLCLVAHILSECNRIIRSGKQFFVIFLYKLSTILSETSKSQVTTRTILHFQFYLLSFNFRFTSDWCLSCSLSLVFISQRVDWTDTKEAVPAYSVLFFIPFTYRYAYAHMHSLTTHTQEQTLRRWVVSREKSIRSEKRECVSTKESLTKYSTWADKRK